MISSLQTPNTDLACDEDFIPGDFALIKGLLEALPDLALVLVDVRAVEVPVADLEGFLDRCLDLTWSWLKRKGHFTMFDRELEHKNAYFITLWLSGGSANSLQIWTGASFCHKP